MRLVILKMRTRACVLPLLAVTIMLTVGACSRSFPENVHVPAVEACAPIHVQGVESEKVWPLIMGDGRSPQTIPSLDCWMRIEQAITGHALVAGNRVDLLIDGPMTFEAVFAALRTARHHIHLETYIFGDDSISRKMSQILIERKRAGVEVRMVIDGYGALQSDESVLDPMREAGIQIYIYHPFRLREFLRPWRINTRHHRKMLIVDGRIGFLGGMNISSVYASSSSIGLSNHAKSDREGWRDTHLRIQGPIVSDLQSLFVTFWAERHDETPLEGSDYFPDLSEKGAVLARVAHSMAEKERYEVYRVYLTAFRLARRSIWITQGYFSPDRTFIDALKAAAWRGVDVRLLLPGLTDSWITIKSSHNHYQELLEAGVRIFERQDVLQHSKTAVIDGVWSLVGSTNLDHRSFMHANEANLVMWGEAFAERMQSQFLLDQEKNTEIHLSQWRQRPFYDRLWETVASLFDYWL
jgi:cardiolipin synthase